MAGPCLSALCPPLGTLALGPGQLDKGLVCGSIPGILLLNWEGWRQMPPAAVYGVDMTFPMKPLLEL